MLVPFTLVRPDGQPVDLQAEIEGSAELADILTAAGVEPPSPSAPIWIDGRLAHVADPVDLSGLRPGSVVSLAQESMQSPLSASAPNGMRVAPDLDTDVASRPHLAVTGGPCAGLLTGLAPGSAVAGRAPECDIHLPDPTVSNRHFRVEVAVDGTVYVEDLESTNGVMLDGEHVSGRAELRPGQFLVAGATVMELRTGSPPDAVLHVLPGARELRRPPRLLPPAPDAEVAWPEPPAARSGPVVPLASAVLPLVLGVVMYLVTKQVLMLLFLLMTPLLVMANFVTAKRSGRKEKKKAGRAYTAALAEAEAKLATFQTAEKAARSDEHPDPAYLFSTVTGPRRRLWERRPAGPDFLDVRIGLATLPSRVRLVSDDPFAKEQKSPPPVANVPCTCSLRELGVIGVSGPDGMSRRNAMWMVAQQAILSGPADLELVVLATSRTDGRDPWAWARWLPHVAAAGSAGRSPASAIPGAAVEDRARELVQLVESRLRLKEQNRGAFGSATSEEGWPWVLVVLDPAHDIRRMPGIEIVLQQGPAVQVVAICVEEMEAYLPPECRAVVVADKAGVASLERSGAPNVDGILTDGVLPDWCETVGRLLASVRDPEVRLASGLLPTYARLMELLDLVDMGSDAIASRWAAGGRTTAAVVGLGPEGPFSLDLRTDGPHGLVAGTTGAGKSEFLQTLVASLAVANRPDSINFLLVDYKGGSAFRDCARLPHTVGLVTDLDGHLVERALMSLTAELKRREQLLAEAAAKDIDDYQTMGEPLGPLPRLLIVIDEFAGLVTELPDFVAGLVGIAQRGRSLGIHLILATQRPSGVVSPEIRANTNLRVALRVVSPAESVDIIDAPDAARISPATPGRALAVTGHSTLTPFQSARVGGPAATDGGPSAQVSVAPFNWATAGRRPDPQPLTSSPADDPADPTDTDLARIVTALVGAADLTGASPQLQPWLPPLPEQLSLEDLEAPSDLPAPGTLHPVALGLIDLPAVQRQEPWRYDPVTARHLLIAGNPGSGRTTAMRAVAAALAAGNAPEDLWLYAIDCGGGELRRLDDLPHCGAVVTRSEPDRVDRLLRRLHQEMHRRRDLLAYEGHADLAEHRAAEADGNRFSYIVVLIDRWEGFLSAFDQVDTGRLTDTALDLAREGGSVGIRLVVTGDRQVLIGKLATMVDDRLCLNLADRADYSMAGIDPRRVPPAMGPGRALRTGDQAELQIAVPGGAASGAAQTAALIEVAARWQQREVSSRLPFRIDALPDKVDLQQALSLPSERTQSAQWALVGVGGNELSAFGLDLLDAGGGFVVAGPRRSGRSTALVVMARSLLASGSAVLAFCPRQSPLRGLEGTPGVVRVVNGEAPSVADTLSLVNTIEGPLAVLVDDASLLHGSDLAELLESIARNGPEQGHVMVIAGGAEELARPMRGFIVEARQCRTGLLLCPESHLHGEVIGVRLPRSSVFNRPTGRGVLVVDDGMVTVQVPWPG